MDNKNNEKNKKFTKSNTMIIAAVIFVVIAVIVFVIALSLFAGGSSNDNSDNTPGNSGNYNQQSSVLNSSDSDSSQYSSQYPNSSSSLPENSSTNESTSSTSKPESTSVPESSSTPPESNPSSNSGNSGDEPGRAQVIIENARLLLGTPFEDGGSDSEGFDSSGFVYFVMRESGYVSCPRDIREQAVMGTARDFEEKQPGDVLFFSNEIGGTPNFAGFYTGDGKMIGCLITSAFEGVVEVNINNDYYREHFVAGVGIS